MPRRLGRDIAERIRYLVGHPVIRTLTLLGVGNRVAGGAVTGLLVVSAVRQLGMSDEDTAADAEPAEAARR